MEGHGQAELDAGQKNGIHRAEFLLSDRISEAASRSKGRP
jgi:hypothetical protein